MASVRNSSLTNITFGEDITAPAWVYFPANDGVAWKADGRYQSHFATALVLDDGLTGDPGQAYFGGECDWPGGGLNPGAPYYNSTVSPGAMMTTKPDVWQFLGYALTADVFMIVPGAFTRQIPGTSGRANGDMLVITDYTDGTYNWAAPSSSAVVPGGNTLGATLTIGTNDANALSLETNSVARATVTGGASTGGAWTFTDVTANTNTVENVMTIAANSSGTAAAGFGTGLLLQGESSTTDNQDMAAIKTLWSTATHASRTADLTFSTVTAGAALSEVMRVTNGAVMVGTTTQANSGTLTVANTSTATGAVTIVGSNTALTTTPASSSSAAFIGVNGDCLHTGSQANTNSTGIVGLNFSAQNQSSAAVTNLVAVRVTPRNTSTGSVASLYGATVDMRNSNASGTVTSAYGYAVLNITNAGTMTNTYGFYVGDITTGTQTNTPYSFYASDANAHNYFAGSVKIGGTATRGTTEGTGQLVLFNGTAPAGTLTNGVSLYSASGELRVMDAAGNSTLLSPHDHETNEWIYYSKNTVTGKVLRIDMERMMKAIDASLGGGFIQEYTEEI